MTKKREPKLTDINKVESMGNKSTKEVSVYACGYCAKLYRDKSQADLCHMDRTCGECGKVIEKKDYYVDCEECRLKKEKEKKEEMFKKAKKMTYEEYASKYPNHPVCDYDNYFFDVDSALDYIDEHGDCILWGTTAHEIQIDADNIIQQFEEAASCEEEEFDNGAVKDLRVLCNLWNKSHSETVYICNEKIAILLET